MKFTVRVPATSANLGPGFDSFGLALQLYNDVTVDTDAEPGVTWVGEGAGELPTDGSDMVSEAMRLTAREYGTEPPKHQLQGVNGIPLERGLGSSSAAAVAGVLAAFVLLEKDPDAHAVFSHAAEFEGHPDNAAPASFGGFTIVADGFVRRFDPHPGIRPVLLVPDEIRLPTGEARRALHDSVARRDAIFNLSHAGLAVAGFTQDPDLLLTALHDRMHEDTRMSLVPEAMAVLERVRKAQVPACVSGAGPSLIAFQQGDRKIPDPGSGWKVLHLEPDLRGARIV